MPQAPSLTMRSIHLLLPSFIALLASCSTVQGSRSDAGSTERNAPQAVKAAHYASPFTGAGVLTSWARAGLDADIYGAIPNVAVDAVGGWEAIYASSDARFDSVEELTIHLVEAHGKRPAFQDAVRLTAVIYPEFGRSIGSSIETAASVARASLEAEANQRAGALEASAKREIDGVTGEVDATIHGVRDKANKAVDGVIDGIFGRSNR